MDIKEVMHTERIENEYDLHKASLLERNLRLMLEENPDLKPIRQKLRDLIKDYEDRNWSDLDIITDVQIENSNKAEEIIDYEQRFIQKRK